METRIVTDLNPVYEEIYMSALRGQGLQVYTKDQNLDGWIRAKDIFLVYDQDSELRLAEDVVEELEESEESEE